jgi:site-specific recombinase XerD
MTPLRKHMIEDMQLRGLSARTQEVYLYAVRDLARYFRRSPDQLKDEDLRRYFLYLRTEKKLSRSSTTIALCAIKFLYETTLQQPWPTLELVRPPKQYKLPVVLSREEVRRILAEVRIALYRVCLTTIYSCGLRLSEARQLRVTDIDSSRMMLRIHGKGNKDRYVPLPQRTLELLRAVAKAPVAGMDVSLAPIRGRFGVGSASGLRVPSRFESLWRSETGSHSHVAPFLRDPSAGDGHQSEGHSRESRTP